MIRTFTLFSALALAGCAAAPRPAAPIPQITGVDQVMRKDAVALNSLLGKPDLDIREGSARKLHFSSSICVLDLYLYPPAPGANPVVTYVDARLPSGEDFDRASCVAALLRRSATSAR